MLHQCQCSVQEEELLSTLLQVLSCLPALRELHCSLLCCYRQLHQTLCPAGRAAGQPGSCWGGHAERA